MKKFIMTMAMAAFSVMGMAQLEYGKWETAEVTDEFGDPTGETVVSAFFEGTFSNSATTNSELTVRALDYGDALMLKFFEYSRTPEASMCHDGCFGEITVKRESGSVYTYEAFAPKSGGLFFSEKDKFLDMFRHNPGETIKVIVREDSFSDYGSSKYIFTITLP